MPVFRIATRGIDVCVAVFLVLAASSVYHASAEEPRNRIDLSDSLPKVSLSMSRDSSASAPTPPPPPGKLAGIRSAFSPQAPNFQASSPTPARQTTGSPIATVAYVSSPEGETRSSVVNASSPEKPSQGPEFQTTPIPVRPEETGELQEPERLDESNEQSMLDSPIAFSGRTKTDGKMLRPTFSNAIGPLVSILGSLLIVLSVFLILVLLLKKVSPKGSRPLPKEAFENLGRTFLTQKIQLQLLRLGNRLILVSVTQDGVSPITEITDPDEVVPLLGLCRRLDTNSSSELFRSTLAGFSGESEKSGYFGSDVPARSKTSKTNESKPKSRAKTKSSSLVDLYSEPDESLADILASGFSAKGGSNG